MQFRGNVFFRFLDEDQDQQGSDNHQRATEIEGITGIDVIERPTD